MKKFRRLFLSFVLISSFCLSAAACSKGYKADVAAEDAFYVTAEETKAALSYKNEEEGYLAGEEDFTEEAAEAETAAGSDSSSSGDDASGLRTEKLVYRCDIAMETTDFSGSISAVKSLINQHGGFIEYEEQSDEAYGWYHKNYRKTSGTLHAYITVRIPAEHYEAFLNGLDGNGKITNKTQNVQNITKRYYETETTIRSLEAQEERLLEMMASAENIESMLAIEARLSDVQNELALHKNDLSDMDTDVSYSTVTLRIDEVLEYTEPNLPKKTSTFSDRLKNTLENSWDSFKNFSEGLLFFLISAFPYLVIIALILTAVIMLTKKQRARKKAKKEAKKKAIEELQKEPQDTGSEETEA